MMDVRARARLWLRARRIRRRGDPELGWLPRLVGDGRRAIDIGANRGVYTWWLSRCCQHVDAFEPNPDLAARLAAAGLRRVAIHNLALSDVAGEAEFSVPRHRKGGLDDPGGRLGAMAESGARFSVTLARLDDLALDDVDFIKIDVEGHEEKVLDGGWQTIIANRPVLLVELEERLSAGCLARVRERLEAVGFEARFLDGGNLHPVSELAAEQKGRSGRYINNFLFFPAGHAQAGIRAE